MRKYLLTIMKGQRKGFLAQVITWALVPFSLVYGLGVFCHRHFYRLRGAYKAPKPVISVGNITVGGTGKTPLVIWLARNLQDKGLKPVILIRGYMPLKRLLRRFAPRNDTGGRSRNDTGGRSRNDTGGRSRNDTGGRSRNDTVLPIGSDEADMLNEQMPLIPVLAGGNRAANIRKSSGVLPADVYIADDAFQHWPLERDLNIVAIDAGNPFGNGYLLPAGTLREGLCALKRAHVFVLTKTEDLDGTRILSSRIKEINPKALIIESRYKAAGAVGVFEGDILPDNFLNDRPVAGFCAIGDPLSFKSGLENSGAKVAKLFSYMDHHVYTKGDIQRMAEFCRAQNIEVLVTTHKDAVKSRAFKDQLAGIRLVYMPIQLEITQGADEFFQKVISVCRG